MTMSFHYAKKYSRMPVCSAKKTCINLRTNSVPGGHSGIVRIANLGQL